jgi:hypothetical protein
LISGEISAFPLRDAVMYVSTSFLTVHDRLHVRRKVRPRLRWMDDVVADLRAKKVREWTEKAEDREQWRLVVKEAKADPGL